MLTQEQKKEFSDILETLGENLDITETQFKAAVTSYKTVGEWLSKGDSELANYNPEVKPQGSFILGTMIQPITEEDDLDIDLVCELTKKKESWTQYDLKQIVGNQLKSHKRFDDLLDDEGRRCWTLKYRQDSDNLKERYHMDILPSITSEGYETILNESYKRAFDIASVGVLGISITDNENVNYYTSKKTEEWLKSNPFGYAQWFFDRAQVNSLKMFSLNEAVQEVPVFQKEKLPLQRIVQILKRHRDMMYKDRKDKKDKPISIIITTLASLSYNKEINVLDAFENIISNMHLYIKDRNPITGKEEKYIANPVNPNENFADKWEEFPEREKRFYEWLEEVRKDFRNIISQAGKGLQFINESMKKPFGESIVLKSFNSYGIKKGASYSITNPKHKFYGIDEV